MNVNKMLREITSIQWMHWKMYMTLAPFGEEIENVRNAAIVSTLVNLQVAKSQGAYDVSKIKRGSRPVMQPMTDFVLRFGDMPAPVKPVADVEPLTVRDIAESWGGVPIKDHRIILTDAPYTSLDVVATDGGKATTEVLKP